MTSFPGGQLSEREYEALRRANQPPAAAIVEAVRDLHTRTVSMWGSDHKVALYVRDVTGDPVRVISLGTLADTMLLIYGYDAAEQRRIVTVNVHSAQFDIALQPLSGGDAAPKQQPIGFLTPDNLPKPT
jgi:hypothetical protein